jgi:hypothetical protein
MLKYVDKNPDQAQPILHRKKTDTFETVIQKSFRERACDGMRTPVPSDEDGIPRVMDYFAVKYAHVIDQTLTTQTEQAVNHILSSYDATKLTQERLLYIAQTQATSPSLNAYNPNAQDGYQKNFATKIGEQRSKKNTGQVLL